MSAELIAKLAQVEQERDEARRHLQEIVDEYNQSEMLFKPDQLVDAIHLAAIYLKGGI